MASPKSKKSTASRTKSAFADESFYHQLRAGGERGWNDIYVDPKDAATGTERYYLKYYGTGIASVELVEKDGNKQAKITVFSSPDKSPVPSDRPVDIEEWNNLFDGVILAVQSLYQA